MKPVLTGHASFLFVWQNKIESKLKSTVGIRFPP